MPNRRRHTRLIAWCFSSLTFLLVAGLLMVFAQQVDRKPSEILPNAPAGDAASEKAQTKSPAELYREGFLDPYLADGFDFPVGDVQGQGTYRDAAGKTHKGWYVAVKFLESYEYGIHPGEDWNGKGGGDTDLGQPVYAVAHGQVKAVTAAVPYGNMVSIEHRYLDNGAIKRVFSHYVHLGQIKVKQGDWVQRRSPIGTIGKGDQDRFVAHLHFEIRRESMADQPITFWPSSNQWTESQIASNYERPTDFIQAHRSLLHPATCRRVLLAHKSSYEIDLIEKGKLVKTFEVALSQKPLGHKQREGDLRMPEGEYKIVQKSLGPFAGADWMKYLGVAWLRIDYPNVRDAEQGLAEKAITPAQCKAIVTAHERGVMPPKDTALGGGIGIHGWADPGWNPEGNRDLTWGCISLNKSDLLELYKIVPQGTPIVIRP